MLSLFPSLLSYQQLAPTLIRITLAVVLIYWAYTGLREASSDTKNKFLFLIEIIIGALLLIGLWTQAAAGIAVIGFVMAIYRKIKQRAFLTNGVNYLLILLIMTLSLIFTGPGFWGYDMPM